MTIERAAITLLPRSRRMSRRVERRRRKECSRITNRKSSCSKNCLNYTRQWKYTSKNSQKRGVRQLAEAPQRSLVE